MIKQEKGYTLKIDRTIVDDLGVKLYDKISAVVAEIIANSYDADAEKVIIELPLGKALATMNKGQIFQTDQVIKISDDGHGMTPKEADDYFLVVGRHRRDYSVQGDLSRTKKRSVMGRKGLGKLAPFGVCKTIEIRSAGGEKSSFGYKVAHFELNYGDIIALKKGDRDYHPKSLQDDGKYDATSGTAIVLKNFLPKRVQDKETFSRQLSARFGLGTKDFAIKVKDTKENPEPEFLISETPIPTMPGTKINLDNRPVILQDETKLNVKGWIGMAKHPYKNEEFAGVRIYVRGKMASITRDFGAPAGFSGEFVARSYLVGEIHADWLDKEEDLIQTHRQDILWSSEIGQAFSEWGRKIIKEVALKGREPRRLKVSEEFINKSNLKEMAHQRYNDPEIEKAALELGEEIGRFASEDELENEDYITGLREIVLTVAPHKLLVDAFKEIQKMAETGKGKIDAKELVKLFQTTKIAQLASYGQIVAEKVKAIGILREAIRNDVTSELDLQKLLEDSPWLIDPRWEPITANQAFKSFREACQSWFKKKLGKNITTSTQLTKENKRADFILLHVGKSIKIVEIKPPKHQFDNTDWERLNNYDDIMTEFFDKNQSYVTEFPDQYTIILIADEISIKNSSNKKAFNSLKTKNILETKTWNDLLLETNQFHKKFLDARDSIEK